MFKTHYHKPGTAPATLMPTQVSASDLPPRLSILSFDEHTLIEAEEKSPEALLKHFDQNRVNWINIDGISDIEILKQLGERFMIHPLALEDILNTTQRPKVEKFDEHLFIVLQMVYEESDACIVSEQVSLFLGPNYVLTIQEESSCDVFDAVRQRIRQARGFARRSGADYLAYALVDAVIDHFFPVLESVGEEIEDIEEELLDHPNQETVRRLYETKRALLQIRRAAWPTRELVSFLSRNDSEFITPNTIVFLRDCYDHAVQIIELTESYRDVTAGMMDIYLSSVSLRTNEIMRVLTVISSIFIPLTFIAGVYGMNFNPEAGPWNMPELNYPYGYLVCVLTMLGIAGGMLLFFRSKRWI